MTISSVTPHLSYSSFTRLHYILPSPEGEGFLIPDRDIKSYKQYLEYNEIDQDDMLRVFSDLAVKWYGISILELNNEELVLIGDALDTLL